MRTTKSQLHLPMNILELQTRARGWQAFILVDLLVVLALLGVLVLTVAAGTSGDVSKRLACADNLRRLYSATQTWGTDNAGVYPNRGADYPYYVSQSFRNTLTNAYKLERKNFYCPANPSWNNDSLWDFSSSSSVLGYSYFAGYPDFNSPYFIAVYYPANGALPGGDNLRNHLPVFAVNLTDQPYYPILWTDLSRKYLGDWRRERDTVRGANHFGTDKPLGQNEVYLDGRVAWAAFAKFPSMPRMQYNSLDFFFYAGRP